MNRRVETARPLVDQVYELIMDDICRGVFRGGEMLRQEAVAERYGVSRQPVQQAFVLLKRHGIVREAGKRGLQVLPIDLEYVNHLYDMRELLDVHAVRLLTSRGMSEDSQDELQRLMERGTQAAADRNFAELVAADAEFHSYFYTATGNPFLIATADLLSNNIRRVMAEILARGGVPSWVWEDHDRIVEAVMSGDTERAGECARSHVEHGRLMMLENLSAADARAHPTDV